MASTVATVDDIRQAANHGRSMDRRRMVGVAVLWPLLLFVAVWLVSGAGSSDVPVAVLWAGSLGTLLVIAFATQRAYRCPLRCERPARF